MDVAVANVYLAVAKVLPLSETLTSSVFRYGNEKLYEVELPFPV
jgi:hypothetical protein